MPASRWHSNFNDLFQWIGSDEEILSLIMPPFFSQPGKHDPEAPESNASHSSNLKKYPDVVPILPLRGVVVYPQTAPAARR